MLFWMKMVTWFWKNEGIAKIFNDFFGSIVDNLDLHHWEDKASSPTNTRDNINYKIKNYENHPSISIIKTKYWGISNFSFRPVFVEEVKKIIRDLKTNKALGKTIKAVKFRLRY